MAGKNKRKKEIEHKKPFNILLFIIVLLISYIFLVIFFHIFGPFYVKTHLFIFDKVIKIFLNDFKISYDNKNNILFHVTIYTKDSAGNDIPSNCCLTTPGSILYIIPIIVYSLICAWPVDFKRKILFFFIAGFFIEFFCIIDIPLYCINQFRLLAGIYSWFSKIWEDIAGNGGRQFIAIIIFFISLKISQIFKYEN